MRTHVQNTPYGPRLLIHNDMISEYVAAYGAWSPAEAEFFAHLLPEHADVIEVGAHIGTHTLPLAKHCRKGQIIAYEPQRPIYYALAANLALNDCLNVHAKNTAVGDQNGRIALQTSAYDARWNYGNFSLQSGFSDERQYTHPASMTHVPLTSLDSDPDANDLTSLHLLKIDAEGSELAVLRGAEAIIRRHQPTIYVEATRAHLTQQIAELLGAEAYSGFWLITIRARLLPGHSAARDIAPLPATKMEINAVFEPIHRASRIRNLTPIGATGTPAPDTPVFERFPHPDGAPYKFQFSGGLTSNA